MTDKIPEFNMHRYQELALRTESPITPNIERDLVHCWEMLEDVLTALVDNGKTLDKFKRHVFYQNRDEEVLEQLMPGHPSGEKAQRIVQAARMFHALVGLGGELGEQAEKILKYVNGESLDRGDMIEEGGDYLWYINLFLSCLNTNIPATAQANIAKLAKRFKSRFTTEEAIGRDPVHEMLAHNQALEQPQVQGAQSEEPRIGSASDNDCFEDLRPPMSGRDILDAGPNPLDDSDPEVIC